MNRRTAFVAVVAAVAAAALIPAVSASSHNAAPPAATVAVSQSRLGRILVDGRGRTLYLFEKDKGAASTCYGSCASVWPPLTTKGKPRAGLGALTRKLATTKRRDGTLEVTYNRHPLYLYAGDARRGDTKGQGLDQFGAEWYVLSRAGKKVEHEGS